eukprot:1153081-Pelagomonas_calceolata.AAC.1
MPENVGKNAGSVRRRLLASKGNEEGREAIVQGSEFAYRVPVIAGRGPWLSTYLMQLRRQRELTVLNVQGDENCSMVLVGPSWGERTVVQDAELQNSSQHICVRHSAIHPSIHPYNFQSTGPVAAACRIARCQANRPCRKAAQLYKLCNLQGLVMQALLSACRVSSTAYNEDSSRSHTICRLHVDSMEVPAAGASPPQCQSFVPSIPYSGDPLNH